MCDILYYRCAQTLVARATKLCKTARNICGSPARNLLHVSHLAPRNFEVVYRFRGGGMCAILLNYFTEMCLQKDCLDKLYNFTNIILYG